MFSCYSNINFHKITVEMLIQLKSARSIISHFFSPNWSQYRKNHIGFPPLCYKALFKKLRYPHPNNHFQPVCVLMLFTWRNKMLDFSPVKMSFFRMRRVATQSLQPWWANANSWTREEQLNKEKSWVSYLKHSPWLFISWVLATKQEESFFCWALLLL